MIAHKIISQITDHVNANKHNKSVADLKSDHVFLLELFLKTACSGLSDTYLTELHKDVSRHINEIES